jgi:arylsulfatase A-like enzyme
MADDMGYGDSSAYGGWIKTPHMEALAAQGLRFIDFHSSGTVCSPTRAGLLTGRYQERAGVPGVINADPKKPVHHTGLVPTEVTFPKLLKKAGYTSAIFGKWHLGYHKKYNPLHHGFDRFRGYVSGNIDYISHYDRMGTYDWWEGLELIKEAGYVTHLITRHSVKFIEENKDRPFCLYVAHEAVHSPNQAPGDPPQRGPDRQRGRSDRRPAKETYALMMKAMDNGIGEIVATVKRLGLAENTLILFFSDNGGTRLSSNGALRGHKGTVWEGGHRVPAIAAWPGGIKPGGVTKELCISLDILPTMLDLAGVAAPADHRLDGISLAPLMLEGKSLGRRTLFWRGQAMRDGPWKLVVTGRKGQRAALFNLAEDIGEQNDLAGKHPQRVQTMTAALEAWTRDVATGATDQPARQAK